MGRKRKELPVLEGVKISGVAAQGKALARVDDMVVFVPYAAPGDIVDVKIDKKKKSYAEGHIVRQIAPSDLRVEPKCEHFTVCGGCKWQHLPYAFQLQCKQQQVADVLARIAKVEVPAIFPIIGSEDIWAYRNKMEYTFSSKKWLTFEQLQSGEIIEDRNGVGFHIPGAFDKVLDIYECHLQNDLGNRLRNFIRDYAKLNNLTFYNLKEGHGLLRTLMIRISSIGESMVLLSFGEDNPDSAKSLMDDLRNKFPEISSLLYVVNTKANDTINDLDVKLHSGRDYILEQMEDLSFRIGPKSFYQTNSKQAYRLYSVVRNFAGLTGEELVYDLYTGTGTIAQFIASRARKVIGIEYVTEAIKDAEINAEINGITNTEFIAGDMKNVLTDELIREKGKPDVIIVDPPRAGMHEDVTNVILNAAPATIVYVSCNPATQARDLALLDSKYQIEAVQPVDMFPHTAHVENVVKLKLRKL